MRTTNLPSLGAEPRRGDYRALFEEELKVIHPGDHETARRVLGPEALLAARREGGRPGSCQYRMVWDKPAVWLENRVFFLEEGDVHGLFSSATSRRPNALKRNAAARRNASTSPCAIPTPNSTRFI
ncbi:MAG: hypothetical protein V8Q84_05280 [Bilophila sp.]